MVMQDRHIVQCPSVHEGVGVDGVDGPAWVTWLPPAIHCLWLQLSHLLAKTPVSPWSSDHCKERWTCTDSERLPQHEKSFIYALTLFFSLFMSTLFCRTVPPLSQCAQKIPASKAEASTLHGRYETLATS